MTPVSVGGWRLPSTTPGRTGFSGQNHGHKAGLLGTSGGVWRGYHPSNLPPARQFSLRFGVRRQEKERMDFGELGWRDAILLVAVAAAIYLVVSLLGLVRLRRRPEAALAVAPPGPGPTEAAASPLAAERSGGADGPALSSPAPGFEAELAAQVTRTALEAEVRQLRVELAALREELAEIKAMRRVSPLYAEAAALAQRGFDARGVAAECGISVAEAELVLAMSRDSRDFDKEAEDGADRQ
jgi:hypothetical protein